MIGWVGYLRVQVRTLASRLETRQAKLRDYAAELIRAEEEERARVSRELHDGVGQLIAAVHLELEALRVQAPEPLVAGLDDLRTLMEQVGSDIRRMSHELRPAILDELGLHEALTALARRMSRPPRLSVELKVRGNLIVLPGDLRLICYRFTQEALTNVVRHSGAHRAEVRVDLDAHALRLAVVDDGAGVDEAALARAEGFGILGMRERVEAVGGSVHFGRADLGGLLVAAELPVG
jgi:signal transduction histidine kinase